MTPKDKQYIINTGFVPAINHGYHVNDKVRIVHKSWMPPNNLRSGPGTVIAIIGVGLELTKEEAMDVYQVEDNHKYLRGFMKPCKVDRIVVRRDDNSSNYIVPSSKLGLETLEHV